MKKSKIYELIGRVTVFLVAYTGTIAFIVWAFLQNTVY